MLHELNEFFRRLRTADPCAAWRRRVRGLLALDDRTLRDAGVRRSDLEAALRGRPLPRAVEALGPRPRGSSSKADPPQEQPGPGAGAAILAWPPAERRDVRPSTNAEAKRNGNKATG